MYMISHDQLLGLNQTLAENGSTFRFVRNGEVGIESMRMSNQGCLKPYDGHGISVCVFTHEDVFTVSYYHSFQEDEGSEAEDCATWDAARALILRYV